MNLRPYHAALANQITGLSMIATSMDLGRAIGFAELAQTAFIPPADRHEVMEAFEDLKGRVAKATLKTGQKSQVATAIDNAIRLIKAQPDWVAKQLARNPQWVNEQIKARQATQQGHRVTEQRLPNGTVRLVARK